MGAIVVVVVVVDVIVVVVILGVIFVVGFKLIKVRLIPSSK